MFPENVQTLKMLKLKMCLISIVLRMNDAFRFMFTHSFTVMLSLKVLLAPNSNNFFAFFYVNSVNNFLAKSLGVFLGLLVLPGLALWPSVITIVMLLLNTIRIWSLNSNRCLSSAFSVVAIIILMLFIFINYPC